MKKRMLAMLLVLSMFALTACGGKETQETTDAPAKTEEAAAAETETKEESTEGELEACTLNYVSWMTKGEDNILLDGFMAENPQIEVVNRSLDGGSYSEVLMPMILNGDIPDVFIVQPPMVKELAKEGFIQPITDLPAVADQAVNAPGLNAVVSYNGDTYGYILTGTAGNGFVYYNKVYFQENGLEIPETYEEFEALCETINGKGDTPIIISAGDTWSTDMIVKNQQFVTMANMGEFGETKGAQIALLKGDVKVSDLYRLSFETLASYRDKGWVSQEGLSMGWEAATQYLVDGGGQMLVSGNWVPTSAPIQENTNENFELGAFVLPGVPDENGVCHEASSAELVMVLSAKSENPEAAEALFNYIKREDVLVNYINTRGSFGINVKGETNPVLADAYTVVLDPEKYSLEDVGMSYMPSNWRANYSQYAADIFSGVDIEELLAKLDADFETAMSSVNVEEYLENLEN